MQVIGMMPLRGGSKSIPDKNMKEFRGESLFIWNLTTLVRSNICDYVFIDSDIPDFHELIKGRLPGVMWYENRNEWAHIDTCTTIELVNNFIDAVNMKDDDVFILTQATSPYLREIDCERAWWMVVPNGFDSVMTAGRLKRWLWHDNGLPMNRAKDKHVRRQDWEGTLIQNGCLYCTTAGMIRKTGMMWGGKLGFIEQPYWFELDEPQDWELGEKLLGPPPANTAAEEIENLYKERGWDVIKPWPEKIST